MFVAVPASIPVPPKVYVPIRGYRIRMRILILFLVVINGYRYSLGNTKRGGLDVATGSDNSSTALQSMATTGGTGNMFLLELTNLSIPSSNDVVN